jgi:uncharacterized protein YjeT (DUF2065 family)
MQNTFVALALMLVFEGLLPFLSPPSWRMFMRRIGTLSDGQIRFFGLASIVLGLALFLLLVD